MYLCGLWGWSRPSPFVEEDGDDNAYDEDNGEHRAHHPDEAFVLVDDRLGVDLGSDDGVGVGTGGVHDLRRGRPDGTVFNFGQTDFFSIFLLVQPNQGFTLYNFIHYYLYII